jgi:hypothetical protein
VDVSSTLNYPSKEYNIRSADKERIPTYYKDSPFTLDLGAECNGIFIFVKFITFLSFGTRGDPGQIRSSASPLIYVVRGGPLDETAKTKALCHSRCDTVNIPPCSKTLSAEHNACI